MQVNGQYIQLLEPICISDFVKNNSYSEERVAVEKNRNIIPKANFITEMLTDDDIIEIVHFVGGG